MHYTPQVYLAFSSVEHIMRDVNNGWILRYLHANGASFFFIWVYIHIGRGLYYGSYRSPRGMLWNVGVVIYILMMAQVGPIWNDSNLFLSILAIKRIGPHNKIVLDQIICSLLGDGWMDRIPSKKRFSYRFGIDQESYNNGEYIKWLTNWFYEQGYSSNNKPKKQIRNNRVIYRLNLYTYTSFDWIYKDFYYYKLDPITNKLVRYKKVPIWIEEYLSPAGLAAWIMQDGSRQKGQGVMIATNSFTYEECNRLASFLSKNYGQKTTVIKAGKINQYKISIWKESMPLLNEIVGKYIIGNMIRKIRI